ncbi:ATP-binding protein [Actinoplanes rectilineatus]|uniref:ATP-binding protein n=1 Tax=Actinoplanes rectilineatus TaxID=113571 RepID=UPI0005F2FE41|nr:BTAD domain-containing putative transcriptional regulator [Actinoplanes rectilineatus]
MSGPDELSLRILGPLQIVYAGVQVPLPPRQQASLLALLLAREGRPTDVSTLVELIWGHDAPASAVNSLQKYVGTLRRIMQPGLPARDPGTYLRRERHGYLIAAGPGTLDLARFRELVSHAASLLADGRPEAALDAYTEGLGLWRGPVAEGLRNDGTAAASVFAALDGDFLDTCVRASELATSLGRPDRVLRALRMAAAMAPLNEAVHAGLIVSLAAAGQQAEALVVFGTVRARIAEELGVQPGPALSAAHRRVLTGNLTPVTPARSPRPARTDGGLVGRGAELAALRQAVEAALGGASGLVLVEGEPGSGKTRLLEEIAGEAGRLGSLAVWGRCLGGDGTPSMWPWVQVVRTLLAELPATDRTRWLSGELRRLTASPGDEQPDQGTRFRLFEQVVAVIGEVSGRRPVLLLIDDLQWADAASLRLFGHLAARLPRRAVVVGALRDRTPDPGSELTRVLALASRTPRYRRIHLGALDLAATGELVRRDTGQVPGPEVVRAIHLRTAGNPFFVRELTRLLADGGDLTAEATARAKVPSTVRDVVGNRLAGLDDAARDLLRIAALIGRDVDIRLLADVAGVGVPACLDLTERLENAGLLRLDRDSSLFLHFKHDLVRESVVAATPSPLAAELHLRIADALERSGPDDEVAESLAHHLLAAGPLAGRARTATALLHSGRHAAAKSALEVATDRLEAAAETARSASEPELELSALSRLTAVAGMRAGYHSSAPERLERAERLARELGREREATAFLFSRRAAYSQAARLDLSGRLARQLLDDGSASADPVVRAYGYQAWGIHQWDLGNVGEAYRHLSRTDGDNGDGRRSEQPLRYDLGLLSAGILAETTALHGDVPAARALLDDLEAAAGDDPYAITVVTSFAARVAALAGNPAWALAAAGRGIAADPGHSYTFFGAYLRLARYWARAVTGDASAAPAAERLVAAVLLDPPRSNLHTWYALCGEMWLESGRPAESARALNEADRFLDAHGQRYAEGLLLLLRARHRHARGEPLPAVRAAAEHARALSIAREAHLFAHRAAGFLATLPEAGG